VPTIGWPLVHSAEYGAVVLGPDGVSYLDKGRVEGVDPLAHLSPTAARHLLRTDRFAHVADIMVGSFYDPVLDEAARSRSSARSTAGWAARRPVPSSSRPPGCRSRRSRSSEPPPCAACCPAGAGCSRARRRSLV
jgi:hypothetical protein